MLPKPTNSIDFPGTQVRVGYRNALGRLRNSIDRLQKLFLYFCPARDNMLVEN
jgi:hypothetical protein